jgi:hypothetical protein
MCLGCRIITLISALYSGSGVELYSGLLVPAWIDIMEVSFDAASNERWLDPILSQNSPPLRNSTLLAE